MDTNKTSSHEHHFSAGDCSGFGLKIEKLEDDQMLQEAVLSVHHAYMATFNRTAAVKIVESQNGQSWVVSA